MERVVREPLEEETRRLRGAESLYGLKTPCPPPPAYLPCTSPLPLLFPPSFLFSKPSFKMTLSFNIHGSHLLYLFHLSQHLQNAKNNNHAW